MEDQIKGPVIRTTISLLESELEAIDRRRGKFTRSHFLVMAAIGVLPISFQFPEGANFVLEGTVMNLSDLLSSVRDFTLQDKRHVICSFENHRSKPFTETTSFGFVIIGFSTSLEAIDAISQSVRLQYGGNVNLFRYVEQGNTSTVVEVDVMK